MILSRTTTKLMELPNKVGHKIISAHSEKTGKSQDDM